MLYTFEKYRGPASKHTCPACEHKRTFTRYIDTETGQYLHHSVGRCDREDNCGYHYPPKEYFRDNPQRGELTDMTKKGNKIMPIFLGSNTRTREIEPREPGRIPKQYLIRSLGYDSNFVAFLCSIFDRHTLESPTIVRLMEDYYFGATKDKSVIFWQIDERNRICAGKIMQYSPATGKRVKNASGAIDWVHSKLKRDKVLTDDFSLEQCLFGEHLLKRYPDKAVCVVESEKSAIIGAGAMSEYLWVATGGKQGLKCESCRPLKNRNVILFPDLGAFDQWKVKGEEIARQVGFRLHVSDLLEQYASDDDRAQGLDIADYLIRQLLTAVPELAQVSPAKVPARPLTHEEKALLHLGSLNPNVYALIDTLGLVSTTTGEKLRTQIN